MFKVKYNLDLKTGVVNYAEVLQFISNSEKATPIKAAGLQWGLPREVVLFDECAAWALYEGLIDRIRDSAKIRPDVSLPVQALTEWKELAHESKSF